MHIYLQTEKWIAFFFSKMDLDDDSDDSLSSPPETLDQFREKWQQELNTTKRNKENKTTQKATSCDEPNNSNDQVNSRHKQ